MNNKCPEISLYHITHINNLESIINAHGLWCDHSRIEQGFESVNIAHEELKERRMRTSVPLYQEKTLGDFVPFYFTNRSPMLYSISTGHVNNYSDGQKSIIYLVTDVNKVIKCGRKWCFTDGHAVEAFSSFYNDLDELDAIDWKLIKDWSWKNTFEDNDRKRRKQAEFLVEQSVPFSCFFNIAVIDEYIRKKVLNILDGQGIELSVILKSDWYY